MALIVIPDKHISYQCLSTDISGSKVPNASYIGASLYVSDWDRWYRVLDDLSLSPFNYYDVDNITGAIKTIDFAHHEVHDGDSYMYHDVVTMGSGSVVEYMIITPNTSEWAHLGHSLDSVGPITMEVIEASGSRSGSTIQVTYNRNRNSTNVPGVKVYKITTGSETITGSRIVWWSGGTDTNKTTNGAQVGSANEKILKQNTRYIYRLTSGMASNVVSISLDWYEHTNRF